MSLDGPELDKFERYACVLGIPHGVWQEAIVNYEMVLRDQSNEKHCRVMSALDYFCGALEIGNIYLRFIVLVCTAERLFSMNGERSKKTGLADRMSTHLTGNTEDLKREIMADYDQRNNLVHGQQLPRLSTETTKRLSTKWTAWCAEILRSLLLNSSKISVLPQVRGSDTKPPDSPKPS